MASALLNAAYSVTVVLLAAAGMFYVFAATGNPDANGNDRGRLLGLAVAVLASLFMAAMVVELLL